MSEPNEIHEVTDPPKPEETLRERAMRLQHFLLQESYPEILELHPEDRNPEWEAFCLEKGPFPPPSPQDLIWLVNTALAALDVAGSLAENLPRHPLQGRRLLEWSISVLLGVPREKAKLVVLAKNIPVRRG